MTIFTQNKKIKASSNGSTLVYNFGLPAVKTCPNALNCIKGCYARQGAYLWPKVKQAYEARLKLTKQKDFVFVIQAELEQLLKKASKQAKSLVIRVHDSGDFYNARYQLDWYAIASAFPEVKFYAYTKQVLTSEALKPLQPKNFTLIYSQGGKQDALIDTTKHKHSRVFNTEKELIAMAYLNASKNDLKVFETLNVGLVYHGQRSFKNTDWSKV